MPNETKRRVSFNLPVELQDERYCFGCPAYRRENNMCQVFKRHMVNKTDDNFVTCPERLPECLDMTNKKGVEDGKRK